MSSMRLERYLTEHPSEGEAISRLEKMLSGGRSYRVTLDQLADMIDAKSRDELSLILGELSADGLVKFALTVTSPYTNQPIGGYKSFAEIPRTMRDKSTDREIVVDFDYVKPIYEFPLHAS